MIAPFSNIFASRGAVLSLPTPRDAERQSPDESPAGDCHPFEVLNGAFHSATCATGATTPSPGKIPAVTAAASLGESRQ